MTIKYHNTRQWPRPDDRSEEADSVRDYILFWYAQGRKHVSKSVRKNLQRQAALMPGLTLVELQHRSPWLMLTESPPYSNQPFPYDETYIHVQNFARRERERQKQ